MDSFYSYSILPEQKLILCNFQGKISFSEVKRFTNEVIADPSYHATFSMLMDFRHSIAIAYRLELLEYADFLKKSISLEEEIQVGFLIHSYNQQFLMYLWKPIARALNMKAESFRQLDLCLTWLGLPPGEHSDISGKLDLIKSKEISGHL